MENVITYENLSSFAYSNDKKCKQPIRGIVVEFFGLGCQEMFESHWRGDRFTEEGILFVFPYNNPWNWMNRQAVEMTDRILDVLFSVYGLDSATPVVASGGSMGGQGALVYTRYAKRTPVVCVANCPVCDMVYHYSERPDLPRTLYSALYHEEGTLEDALRRISPLHLVGEMPDIPYRIFHCEEDRCVNLHSHSERFVDAMKRKGADISLVRVPGRGHCDLGDEVFEEYLRCMERAILR